MRLDPITGPLSRDEFKALVVAPFGAAAKIIRTHDPLWGLKAGDKIEWKVTATRTVEQTGTGWVKASTKEEAEKLAEGLGSGDLDWDDDYADSLSWDSVTVEPKK